MRAHFSAWLLASSIALSLPAASSAQEGFSPIPRANLCVTEGAVDPLPGARLSVDVPKMRAYVNESTPQAVQTHFTYLGPTANQSQLGSGASRVQFGLKLRAKDACNLIYAMWRIEPQSELVISVKSNPGQHTSAQCSNHGYQNIKPTRSKPVPALHSGETHWLRAEMDETDLTVYVDNAPVWEGRLPEVVMSFGGHVGIRSDNARLQLQLRAPLFAPQPKPAPACRTRPEDTE